MRPRRGYTKIICNRFIIFSGISSDQDVEWAVCWRPVGALDPHQLRI